MGQRQPAVAGRFYPGSERQLAAEVQQLLASAQSKPLSSVIALMAPHAGYIYSGKACAEAMACSEIPEAVILLGPNHHGLGGKIAVSPDDWLLPTATIPSNRDLLEAILRNVPMANIDTEAHHFEHAIEVLLPFLHARQPDVTIVPLTLSQLSYTECADLAEGLARTIEQYAKPVLIVASSDMNHYESRSIAMQKDSLALQKIESFDAEGLYNTVKKNKITMCGVLPMVTTMLAASQLGAIHAKILCHTDSGETSGDTDQVVAYAAAALYK